MVNIRTVCIDVRCATNSTFPGACGRIIAGSYEEPYQGNLKFTFYGDGLTDLYQCSKSGPGQMYIPPRGTLQLHGKRPSQMWARLRQTANKGDNELYINGHVDWATGETLSVVTTGDGRELVGEMVESGHEVVHVVQRRSVPALHPGAPPDTKLTIYPALKFRHASMIEEHAGYTIDMRSEVAVYDSTERLNIRFEVIHKLDNPYFRFRDAPVGTIVAGGQTCGYQNAPLFSLSGLYVDFQVGAAACSKIVSCRLGWTPPLETTVINAEEVVNNAVYEAKSVSGFNVQDNICIECGSAAEHPGGFIWTGGRVQGNAAVGGGQGYEFDSDPDPGFRNNTVHNAVRGMYCDDTCGSLKNPMTGLTAWHCGTAFYMYETRTAAVVNMAVLSNIVTADNGHAVYFNGVSDGEAHHGFTFRNSLVVGMSYGNPSTTSQLGMNLPYWLVTRRMSEPPFACGNHGGGHFANWGRHIFIDSGDSKGALPSRAGETRVHNVAFLRFVKGNVMAYQMGGQASGYGTQPAYFKDITIDNVSRTNLIHLAHPLQDWIRMSLCVRMDCDGRKKSFIMDLDGSLTGGDPETSILARSEFMHEWGAYNPFNTKPAEPAVNTYYFIPTKMLYDPCPLGNDPLDPVCDMCGAMSLNLEPRAFA